MKQYTATITITSTSTEYGEARNATGQVSGNARQDSSKRGFRKRGRRRARARGRIRIFCSLVYPEIAVHVYVRGHVHVYVHELGSA